MSLEHRTDPLAEARELAAERRWEQAATRFEEAGELLLLAGADHEARAALAAAGDAAWRADQPRLALRCFVRARELATHDAPSRRVRGLQMAAVFLDLGEFDSAALVLEEATGGARAPELDLVRLDAQIGLELVRARIGRAHALLEELGQAAGPLGSPVHLFRSGQIAARRGEFDVAVEALSTCAGLIGERVAYQGPFGATLQELAEVAILRGDIEDGLALLDRASSAWERAGRRAGLARVAAARARVLADHGVNPHGAETLAPWIAFADQRGLRVLEAELRYALGASLLAQEPAQGSAHLALAAALAERIGAVGLRGLALLAQHDRPGGDLDALEQACGDLVELLPWRSRAFLALAQRLDERREQHERALELCATALCRLSSMDLPRDEARARGLLWRMSAGI
ncbi:MAG: hypothetical protein ABIO70_19290 [Pseudomonadota bacterium]